MNATTRTAAEIEARLRDAHRRLAELRSVRGRDLDVVGAMAHQRDLDDTHGLIAWLERELVECPEAEAAVKLAGMRQRAAHWSGSQHWSGT